MRTQGTSCAESYWPGNGWPGGICWLVALMKCGSSSNKRCEERGPSRWQRSKTWRSPSSPQVHQKYTYMWNSSYRTPTECCQKTSDFPKDVWLTGSWCSGRVSGQSLWGGRAEFRMWDHQRSPGPTYCQSARALPEISIPMLRPSSTQRPASSSAGHPMPKN